jgi:hypothetical protein
VPDETRPLAEFRQARAAEVAARQWGNITAAQLRAIGFSKDEVYEMAHRGCCTACTGVSTPSV